MARPLRIEFDGAWYHVMNRGLERRMIFRDDDDRCGFLDLLGEVSEMFAVRIHAYSLMDNHYHLLVETPCAQLGRAMRHLNGVYTQRFNKRWHRDGPLFRGRYKALLADETRLFELIQYIHLNPVVAGMTKHVHEHPWTSHHAYVSPSKRPEWLVTTELAKAFGNVPADYRRRMDEMTGSESFNRLKSAIEEGRLVLGRKGFQQWLYRNHVSEKSKASREIASRHKRSVARPDAKAVLQAVALAFDTSVRRLSTPSGFGKRPDRAVAAYLLRQLAGEKHADIARLMRFSSEYAVAKAVHRMRKLLNEQTERRRDVMRIRDAVMSTVKT